MSQIINSKVKDVNVSVQSTGASVANIRMIQNGEVDLALVQTDIADYAWNGKMCIRDRLWVTVPGRPGEVDGGKKGVHENTERKTFPKGRSCAL